MSETELKNPFENTPVIFQYSRAQAIEDGVLIDLTEWAKELGFKVPGGLHGRRLERLCRAH